MPYVNVPKPTGTPYTNVIAAGVVYDGGSISYDDSSIFYDGINTAAYTNLAKPSQTKLGQFIWDQMTMIWNNALDTWGSNDYTDINKPV